MNIFNHKNLPISYKSINILLLALAILPACFLGILILIYSIDVPVMDQWGVPPLFEKLHNGSLSFIDLLAQHNESRKFFPRLIFLSLGYLTHWDVRYEMLIIFLLACVVSLNVYLLSNITVTGSTVKRLLLAIISNLLIFGPIQWDNWLFGIQIVVFVPIVCITTCILVAYSSLATRTKLLISICLSTISTFSYANGILCWVVVLPILILKSRNRLNKNTCLIFVWITGFILNLVVYFYNYKKPLGHPSFSEALVHPLQTVHYFISFLGAPFAFVIGINRLTAATIIGFVLLLLFLASCLYVLKFLTDSALLHRVGGWLTIGLYVILSDVVTTSGRVGFGVEHSLSGRYTTFSIYFTLSLVYIITIIVDDLKTKDYLSKSKKLITQSVSFLAAAILVFHLLSSVYAVKKMSEARRERLQARSCLLFINIVPEQECLLKKVYPDIAHLKYYSNVLNNLGYLKPTLVKTSDVQDIQGDTNLSSDYGEFNTLIQESPEIYFASGWAVLPERREPSDAVILTHQNINGDYTMFAVVEEKKKSKKAAKVFKNKSYSYSGWQKTFSSIGFPKGAIKIDAWAFDANTGKAFKLNGTQKITESSLYLAIPKITNIGEINFKPVVGSSPNGFFEQVNGSSAKTIEVQKANIVNAGGWAILVNEGKPADKVIVTHGENNSVIAVASVVNSERPDVAKALQNNAYFQSGWSVTFNSSILPAGKVVLKAWAYNAARKEATQLNNSFEVVVLK